MLLVSCKPKQEEFQIASFTVHQDAFWDIIPRDAVAERIGIRFDFTEGPAWHPGGLLLFSDIPANKIYSWDGRGYEVFLDSSGNSNGLLALRDGSLLVCEHGGRCLSLHSPSGQRNVLVDSYKGRRLNSPNDLCRGSDGALYFTDPPWGLPKRNNDPQKELAFNGVFRLSRGQLQLLDSTLSWPNGIALSPDECFLYVANFEGDRERPETWEVFWVRYELDSQGKVLGKERFFQAEDLSLPGGPDGMKVDRRGNLFVTGPGGILVINPQGEHLGTINLPDPCSNLAFNSRQTTLFVTARSTVVRIRLK